MNYRNDTQRFQNSYEEKHRRMRARKNENSSVCLKLLFFRVFFFRSGIHARLATKTTNIRTTALMMTAISSIFLCKKANFTIQAFFEIFKLRNLRQAALLMEPEIVQQNGPMLPHRPNNIL